MMLRFLSFALLLISSYGSLAQEDSVKIECADFENRLDKALEYSGVEYNDLEKRVFLTLFDGKKPDLSPRDLPAFLAKQEQRDYTYNQKELERFSRSLFRKGYRDELGTLFELQEYQSDFAAAFWFWQLSYNYLQYHTIDLKTYSILVEDIGEFDSFNLDEECNQKAFVLMLAKILSDQPKTEKRLNFYTKTSALYDTFFEEAAIDPITFEKDFIAYINSYGFSDSTIENQYFTYNFHISDLSYIPLPQSKSLRDKFREYHEKLFSQDLFYIDTTKIIDRPESWDSLSLLRDIMRAYPDSIMFAPGKTPLERRLEPIIENADADDEWFLAIYAGVLKYDLHDIEEELTRYSPIDFRSMAFRKWYSLFILQEMFNPDRIKSGVSSQYNEYQVYPAYNQKTSHQLNMYFIKSDETIANVTRPFYRGKSVRNFNESNFHLEIFNHEFFKNDENGFRIQLKIDTGGYFIRKASFIEPPMSPEQEKIIFDALSKYRFSQFVESYPDTMGEGWMQIHCKKRTKEESEYDWLDLEFAEIDDVVEEIPAEAPGKENEVFSSPDQPATFIHGEDGLKKFIQNRMPAELDSDESGVVYVRITVNKDGAWYDATIIRGINKELNSIAIDILQEMPHWIPAENDGIKVRSYVTIPVEFD